MVAISWAADLGQTVKLNRGTLIQEVEGRIKDKKENFHKAFNSVLYLNGESFKLGKGRQWGKRLSSMLVDKRISEIKNGGYSEQALSKVERQVLYILRNSQPEIDYPLSIVHLNAGNLEIM